MAYRTRAEAYERLPRKEEDEPDIGRLAQIRLTLPRSRPSGEEARSDLKRMGDRLGLLKGDPRHVFCAYLQSLEVDARPTGEVRRDDRRVTEWLIEVANSPIGHILLSEEDALNWGDPSKHREIRYLVPDPRIGTGLLTPAIGALHLGIHVDLERGRWIMTEGGWADHGLFTVPAFADALTNRGPSRLQRDDYEAVARHLLSTPPFLLGLKRHEEVEWAYMLDLGVALRGLGVDALALELEPFSLVPSGSWLQLSTGPIRWIETRSGDIDAGLVETLCYVPDPRITPAFRRVKVAPVRVKSFPLLGRVKAVQWKVYEGGVLARGDEGLGLRIAEHLSQDTTVGKRMISADDLESIQAAPVG